MVTGTIAGLLLLGFVAWKSYQARQAFKKIGVVVAKMPIYLFDFGIFATGMILIFWMFGKLSLWFAAFSGFVGYLEWLNRFYLGTEGLKAGTKFYERSRLITYEVAEGNGPVIDIIVAGAMDPVRLSCKERDFAILKEQIVRYFEEKPDGPRTANTGKRKISAV